MRSSLLRCAIMAAAVAASSAASAQTTSGGFYRDPERPEVMFQWSYNYYCHVQNPSQMMAFGGWDKVQLQPALRMGGMLISGCRWPNGFYRKTNEAEVYRLFGDGPHQSGDMACHVINPEQMMRYGGWGLVTEVEPSSDLMVGRSGPRPCDDSQPDENFKEYWYYPNLFDAG